MRQVPRDYVQCGYDGYFSTVPYSMIRRREMRLMQWRRNDVRWCRAGGDGMLDYSRSPFRPLVQ